MENQVSILSITQELRGQNPCLAGKKEVRGSVFLRLMFFISFSTNLLCKFMLIVPKYIVHYKLYS